MSRSAGLAHSVPPFKTGAKSLYKMDYAGLSRLNVKTLRGYLLSYNIPTQGMLEKQDLIRAIQSYKPIPEDSEQYFRQHLPDSAEKSSSLFDDLTRLGRSNSPSGSSQESSSSTSGDGWSWDLDKFFSKLFGPEESSNAASQSRGARLQTAQPPRSTSSQPGPAQSNGVASSTPRQQVPASRPTYAPPRTGVSQANASYHPPGSTYRPNTGSTPQASSSSPSRPTTTSSSTYSARPAATSSQPSQPSQPPGGYRQPAPAGPTSTNTQRPSTRPPASSNALLTLEQLMSSKTEPSTLSIKAIKALLDHSCVTYVGIIEKRDLVERLQKLIDNTKAEQEMVQEQEAKSAPATSKSSSGNTSEDDNLCKICCDAALNCVMLNCNHMSTCMDCGKLIMEGSRMCPICREYVVKLLHVFRA
ncbi:RING finger protein 34 [Mortierella alpina]|nr:RING finger protein 34 [Mortierella alpina]